MNPKKFLSAIDTLKQYRRPELQDEKGKELITELYEDPLPGDHVLRTVLRPNTTFLIGRKGTGKSTIFQRAQESLNKESDSTWAYVDIKTLYESSTSEVVGKIPAELLESLSPESIQRIIVFKSFIVELVEEIKLQINTRITSTVWGKVKESFTGAASELFEELDEFVNDISEDKFIDVTGSIVSARKDEESRSEEESIGASAEVKVGVSSGMNSKLVAQMVEALEQKRSENYSKVFIRIFNIRGLVVKLRNILKTLKIKRLYIFIDDFSELPRQDMEQLIDTLLAPLNNWSEEFIKLKIAVYPGRLYSGEIDVTKADQVHLDIYRAYGRNDVSNMEDRAIDFTKRLITKRIKYFCDQSPDVYFDTENTEFWRTLFIRV